MRAINQDIFISTRTFHGICLSLFTVHNVALYLWFAYGLKAVSTDIKNRLGI